MTDNLPELRDIHLPVQGVSAFPPAIGWYVVLSAIIVAIIAYFLIKKALKYSRSRFALKLIAEANINNPVEFASTCSEVLRRICVYKYKKALAFKGAEWQEFLATHCSYKMSAPAMELLINAPYLNKNNSNQDAKLAEEIKTFTKKFIGDNL